MTEPTIGRCAEHPGLHERTEQCRRFMSLAFARDLGIADPDDLQVTLDE